METQVSMVKSPAAQQPLATSYDKVHETLQVSKLKLSASYYHNVSCIGSLNLINNIILYIHKQTNVTNLSTFFSPFVCVKVDILSFWFSLVFCFNDIESDSWTYLDLCDSDTFTPISNSNA